MRRFAFTLACAAALLAPDPARSQAVVSSPVELARRTENLKPGEWIWAPEVAPRGPVIIYVDLDAQVATVYRNGVPIGVSTVSTGKKGHRTPEGVFTILQKKKEHYSNLYNNAPMPNMQRLTWDGIALHAGNLPGYPASHGCIRLPVEFSRLLFDVTETGGTIVIAGDAGAVAKTNDAGILAPPGARDAAAAPPPPARDGELEFSWAPERSPQGPVSIVLSRSSQLMVVLRNGVEIGRSAIRFEDPQVEGYVVTYSATNPDGSPEWIYVSLPGREGEAGGKLDPQVARSVSMPEAFRESTRSLLEPGSTVLVTDAPISAQNHGVQLTVLDNAAPEGGE